MHVNIDQHYFERFLAPRALFVGIVAGFLGCCVLGYQTTQANQYKRFERFHVFLTPETFYYPTACQVRELCKARLPRDKIAVIIGGTSVLHGTGQKVDEVWTRKLQEELGDDFRVLNLGYRAARPAEFGATAAEVFSRHHDRVLLLIDLRAGCTAGAPDGLYLKYFYWDAHYKGLLSSCAARDARLEELAREPPYRERMYPNTPELSELHTHAILDSQLFFNDLWNTVGYKKLFSVWDVQAARYGAFQPRKQFPDPEIAAPPYPQRFQHNNEQCLAMVRDWEPGLCFRDARMNWTERPEGWHAFEQDMAAAIPGQFRSRTLVLVQRFCAHHIRQVSPDRQAYYAEVSRISVRKLECMSFSALDVGEGFVGEDYADYSHLSPSGGEKMAVLAADRIRKMAVELGYRD